MGKFRLAFGIHNHQPIGNFEAVFEEAHQKAYLPFLQLLDRYDKISLSLHQSGILWRWQERKHPDYFELVGKLIDSGRIELLTGGFYEPILCSVPERDAIGQIAMLTDYLERHFEHKPTGLWLTERIWEPHLPKLLSRAEVDFLPVDDTHFLYAGFELEQLTGPFVTENEGKQVRLLPISKRLRYLIPFGKVEEVIAELRQMADNNPEGMIVYADDGEKFGVWPDTHKHCYGDGWLESLFEAISLNSDWLEVVPLSTASREEPAGRAYLPTASYEEMLHWALPPKAFLEYEKFEEVLERKDLKKRFGRFVRGGHWRGFLAKYDEANLMHKRMLRVSDKLHTAEEKYPEKKEELARAREGLYAGQCNCPYWHGVFGGLYLPHIRQAIFANLLEAGATLKGLLSDSKETTIETVDYDADGYDEIAIDTKLCSAIIKPNRGGTLLDLSLCPQNFDLTDTLTRRREGYHLKLKEAVTRANSKKAASIHDMVTAKEEGLADFLVEDWYLKRCFIDHFFTADATAKGFQYGRFGEEGDFIVEPYESTIEQNKVILSRYGHIWRPEGVTPVRINKTYDFNTPNALFTVEYEIATVDGNAIDVIFGIENSFNLQAGHAEDRFVLFDSQRPESSYLDATNDFKNVRSAAMVDQYRDLALAVVADNNADIWQTPIFTVSLSEGGFERVYQGTTLVHLFRLKLSSQASKVSLTMLAGSINEINLGLSRRLRADVVG